MVLARLRLEDAGDEGSYLVNDLTDSGDGRARVVLML